MTARDILDRAKMRRLEEENQALRDRVVDLEQEP